MEEQPKIIDTVSMSEEASTKDTKKDKKKDKKEKKDADKEELSLMKKKMKVLKQALKDESGTKEKMQAEINQSSSLIENLKQEIIDKNKKYQTLFQEKTNLEDSMMYGAGKKDN